jgi:hypothetical protein
MLPYPWRLSDPVSSLGCQVSPTRDLAKVEQRAHQEASSLAPDRLESRVDTQDKSIWIFRALAKSAQNDLIASIA